MITVQVDQNQVKEIYRAEILKAIHEYELDLVFWDTKELMRRTCMSWNNIQEKFFFDKRFPKKKIGQKWYFPAKATREFLEMWINEH